MLKPETKNPNYVSRLSFLHKISQNSANFDQVCEFFLTLSLGACGSYIERM